MSSKEIIMEGRLYRLKFSNYDEKDNAYQPRDAGFLLKLFPTSSVLFANAQKYTSIYDQYISWIIIVASPEPLAEKQWDKLHTSVEEAISLGYSGSGKKLDVAQAGQELDALDYWKAIIEDKANTMYTKQTGSLEKIKEAIGL
jgi:hypothetical protein